MLGRDRSIGEVLSGEGAISTRPLHLRTLYAGDDGQPLIFTVEGLISPASCDGIVAAAGAHGFTRPHQFDAGTRDCQRLHTVDTRMSEEMMRRLRAFLPEVIVVDGVRWRLNRFTHHWRYVEYQPGGHFRPHYDGAKMIPWEITCYTVQVYLNQGFSGGRTRFYMGYARSVDPPP